MLWLNLKKQCLKYFLLLAFLLLVCLPSFSDEQPITENELEAMTKQQLIQAVLIYDKALTEMESLISEDEHSLILREIELQERSVALETRENDLNEREALLILQGNLSETLMTQSKANYYKGFRTGSTISGVLFGFLGGFIMYNVMD